MELAFSNCHRHLRTHWHLRTHRSHHHPRWTKGASAVSRFVRQRPSHSWYLRNNRITATPSHSLFYNLNNSMEHTNVFTLTDRKLSCFFFVSPIRSETDAELQRLQFSNPEWGPFGILTLPHTSPYFSTGSGFLSFNSYLNRKPSPMPMPMPMPIHYQLAFLRGVRLKRKDIPHK